ACPARLCHRLADRSGNRRQHRRGADRVPQSGRHDPRRAGACPGVSATSRIFAVVPAAGKSVRMGAAKLALPLAGRTVLEHVIAALREAQIDDVLVVLGSHVAELAASAKAAGAQALVLDHETAHMRATVERGL